MTRLWCVDPRHLCREHLLGEHAEIHQAVGTIQNHPHGEAIMRGHVHNDGPDDVATERLRERHATLSRELERRGHNHDSPLPAFDDPGIGSLDAADVQANRRELRQRCGDCRARMVSVGVVADD